MPSPAIQFFLEDVKYVIKHKRIIKEWLFRVIKSEGYALEELNFILCSDEYLLVMNQQYLKHDTYTDVITFDNSEQTNTIVGDIFISLDRVKENAELVKVTLAHELSRVMVHGTLHLLGFKDKTKAAKAMMTTKEDEHLHLLNTLLKTV